MPSQYSTGIKYENMENEKKISPSEKAEFLQSMVQIFVFIRNLQIVLSSGINFYVSSYIIE